MLNIYKMLKKNWLKILKLDIK